MYLQNNNEEMCTLPEFSYDDLMHVLRQRDLQKILRFVGRKQMSRNVAFLLIGLNPPNFLILQLLSSFFLPPNLTYASMLCCNEGFYKVKYADQICLP